jgi:hypothetical protein
MIGRYRLRHAVQQEWHFDLTESASLERDLHVMFTSCSDMLLCGVTWWGCHVLAAVDVPPPETLSMFGTKTPSTLSRNGNLTYLRIHSASGPQPCHSTRTTFSIDR